MEYHNPVLLKESVDGLNINPDGVYVDVTFGGGGHSREILSRLSDKGRLYAFDQDEDAIKNTIDDERFTLIHENFRYVKRFLRFHGVRKVDGILGDFGVSSHQFDEAGRGFSIRFDADLDMRMSKKMKISAHDVVNKYSEEELRRMFSVYGELTNAKTIAAKIVASRDEKINTIADLKLVVDQFLPKHAEHKVLAKIFQAIRIEVNEELVVIEELLMQSPEMLEKGGRISFISYHSLEDRLVKRFIRSGLFEGEPEKDFYGNISVPFKKKGKMIVPTPGEIKINNRARSAKLRIAERIEK
ncbi:MAG: 16S rRNA (cytosine(1402)-N(4))-methyltransferase RsmH [Flavobacteriaceae bacterium]|nr:16S rRNA (cytosine(1402)-N(4))-methyltransferase RsmH [Flavobacteriaceae bacterium]